MRFSLNYLFFFSSRRRHTRYIGDWSSDVCSSDLHCRVVAQMTFDVYMAHYTAVADASPVPVVIYNVPVFTGMPLQSKLIIELSKHPKIRGLKDSSGDVKLIQEVSWNTREFPVLAGSAPTLFPAMAAGARGGIVALACAAPKATLALYRAFTAGDYKKTGTIQRIIAPAAGGVTEKYGIAGLKAAMELEGQIG